MPHIHTEPGQHDHTVSAIIIRVDGDQPKVMLHRHKKLGIYMQFGGHIELDETPWDAIVKEIREESGYDIGQLTILQPTDRLSRMSRATVHPQPANYNTHDISAENQHFHTDVVYAFEARDEPYNTPEKGESNDFRLFTHPELLDTPEEEISENAREAAQFILEEISHRWERIPADHI